MNHLIAAVWFGDAVLAAWVYGPELHAAQVAGFVNLALLLSMAVLARWFSRLPRRLPLC
jgi:hypothetical protein